MMHRIRVGLCAVLVLLMSAAATAQPHAVVLRIDVPATLAPAESPDRLAVLERQLEFLRDRRYNFLSLPALVARLQAGAKLPDRTVAVTIDGSRREVCERFAPVVLRLGIPLTIFVDTDAVDAGAADHCSWAQLQALAAGGVTLANASASGHSLLRHAPQQTPAQWRAAAQSDIDRAAQRLRTETGQAPQLLAWPDGENNVELRQLARAAGYVAFGLQSGPIGPNSDRQALPRFTLGSEQSDADRRTLQNLVARIETLPFPIKAVRRPDNPLHADDGIPTLELTLLTPRGRNYRRRRLACFNSDGHRISGTWLSETRFRAKSYRSLPAGRSGYICTLPAGADRIYWYATDWVVAAEPPSPH